MEKAGFTLDEGKRITGGTPLITSEEKTTKSPSATKSSIKRRKTTEGESSAKRRKSDEGTVSKKKPKKKPVKDVTEITAEQIKEGEDGSNA